MTNLPLQELQLHKTSQNHNNNKFSFASNQIMQITNRNRNNHNEQLITIKKQPAPAGFLLLNWQVDGIILGTPHARGTTKSLTSQNSN